MVSIPSPRQPRPSPAAFPATPCRALLQSSLISAPAHLPFSRLLPLPNHLLLPCPTILKPYPARQRIRPSSSSSSSASILRRSMPPRSPCVRVCLCLCLGLRSATTVADETRAAVAEPRADVDSGRAGTERMRVE
ncbi:hypothetical protein KC19_6G109700 [Ceratodon purpureus]|uniref:Uncharacterized protein n=1 Tax=Ceratodon purpureus TaxID=3225 RepID=A0A8T0HFG1_CERPU|nr:hypothetical protein KC19_6G109700 [Ceratodon purpureus]